MSQTEKRTQVARSVRELSDDLSTNTLSDTRRQAILEQLKVWGRNPTGSEAIYCEQGITTLCRYAFGTYPAAVVHEALRVIANALLMKPSLRSTLIELDGIAQSTRIYQSQDADSEFLAARVLFICTYVPSADFSGAFAAGLVGSIEKHLARHAAYSIESNRPLKATPLMAMIETTKLVYNVKHNYPEKCTGLDAVVPSLCTILRFCEDAQPPLEQPVGPLLNALGSLDFGAVPAGSTQEAAGDVGQDLVSRLTTILDQTIAQYKPLKLDTIGIPLVTVLRMLYDTSSQGVQVEMRKRLFPADSERDLPLGQSSSLASKLLRLTTSPGLSLLPEAISGLLFEMSDKDAGKFVKNIGYGYAAGYLMTHKIPIPESMKDGSTTGSSTSQVPVNPVTGQRLDKEAVPDMPEMTEEEKEREAERLFVLFERLKATGVVDVQNPVRAAMEQGRLEEVPDTDSD